MQEKEIKELSDDKLLESLEENLECERKYSHIVLLHLKEIQARRLYAKRGFENIFAMLIKQFRLSETSVNQRLKALALLVDVPQVEASLVAGQVNLSTLAMAQRQIKREEKVTGRKVSMEVKEEIVSKISNKTQREAEIEVMRILPESAAAPRTHEKRVSAGAVRLSLTIPDSLREKLVRLKELWAHIDPAMDFVEVIERMADIALPQLNPALRQPKKTQRLTESVAHPLSRRKTYYGINVDHALWQKAGSQCEYVDKKTGRKCTSRFGLQRDHLVPVALGGSNELDNLRLLCRAHNDLEARNVFSDWKVDKEIRRRRQMRGMKKPEF